MKIENTRNRIFFSILNICKSAFKFENNKRVHIVEYVYRYTLCKENVIQADAEYSWLCVRKLELIDNFGLDFTLSMVYFTKGTLDFCSNSFFTYYYFYSFFLVRDLPITERKNSKHQAYCILKYSIR